MSGQILQPIKGLANTHSKISLTQYNRMVGNVNSLSALVSGGQGVLSSMTAGNIRTNINAMRHAFEEQLIHFTHEVVTPAYPYTGKAAIAIHCGRWSNGVATLLCDTGDTTTSATPSGLYEDFFTVTDIDDDGCICLIRDEGAGTMKPVFSTTFPADADIGVTAFPLLLISWHTVDPSIVGDVERLDEVEPLWFGGDIVTALPYSPYHYQVEIKDSTTLIVHAGATHLGSKYGIYPDGIPFVVDGGSTSYRYDDILTLDISAFTLGAAVEYILAIKPDSWSSPTEMSHTIFPDGYSITDEGKVWPLALITLKDIGATTVFDKVEPMWTGGDITWPIRGVRIDSKKLQYTFNNDSQASAVWVDADGDAALTVPQDAIADISVTGTATDGDCRTKLNALLGELRVAGIISP